MILADLDIEFKLEVIRTLLEIFKKKLVDANYPIINRIEIAKYMHGLVGMIKILVNLDTIDSITSKNILTKLRMINFRTENLIENNITYFIEACTEYSKIDNPRYLNKIDKYLEECHTFLHMIIF